MFAVMPLKNCPHISTVNEVPANGIDITTPCSECASTVENWICLQCYTVNCARSINQHAVQHAEESDHPITLSFTDISVWCYDCGAYIDNPVSIFILRISKQSLSKITENDKFIDNNSTSEKFM